METDRDPQPEAGDPGMETDELVGGEDQPDTAPAGSGGTALPPKIEAWRKRSAAGAILTGFALGLQEALEKRKEEPAIVMETSGDPPRDLPVEAEFEYGRPRASVVQIRPWLLAEGASTDETPQPEANPASDKGPVPETDGGGEEP